MSGIGRGGSVSRHRADSCHPECPFRVKRNPWATGGAFVYDPKAVHNGATRNLVWWVRSEEEANRAVAYPLNSLSKMVTPELEFPLRAGLKYAEVPGTPDVIRYVFEGS